MSDMPRPDQRWSFCAMLPQQARIGNTRVYPSTGVAALCCGNGLQQTGKC
jgi:hypothetical protein